MTTFVDSWRRRKSAAFDLCENSTVGKTVAIPVWGRDIEVYANANLSICSARKCNAHCPFCVEELRPASRGVELHVQKRIEPDDANYFSALEEVLETLRPLDPSVSITGGEPSKDPRLPGILRIIASKGARKRTLTTNGSGLLDIREGKRVIDWIAETGTRHLNISRAHPDQDRNSKLMALREGLSPAGLQEVIRRAKASGTRTRLSCVLLRGAIDDLEGIRNYLDFAESLGVDNVIFRQLMKTDPATVAQNGVVKYSNASRVALEPVLDQISRSSRFRFTKQIVGYYYYVEVWRRNGIDVVFEEADLSRLEAMKREMPAVIHELVFHPNAQLASTWQPWDGVLGPPLRTAERKKEDAVAEC